MIDTVAKKAKDSFPRKRTDHLRSRQLMADTVAPLDDQDREIIAEVKQLRDEREQDERTIQLIPIRQLERHPSNRTIDPLDPSIMSLAESIRENGQLDPMRVRQLAEHRYQIISGERRYTAIKVHLDPAYLARCIVVDIDDAAALREVAVANSNREDLNPVQRAELMQNLMKPNDKGGSGLSLTDAGKLFGLSSESGSKNALRILKLPKEIRGLLVSGELAERHARALIPYANVNFLMDGVIKALKSDNYLRTDILSAFIDEEIPQWMTQDLMEHARPISSDVQHRYHYPILNAYPCLFDWQPHKEKLQIVEVPTQLWRCSEHAKRDEIAPRQWALNAKLYDKLQMPLVKKAEEEGKQKATKNTKKCATKEKALTPAEQKAEAKRKAKEQEQQLDRFTEDWTRRLLRCAIAGRSSNDELVALTLPWIVGQCDRTELCCAHEHALIECPKRKNSHYGSVDTLEHLKAFNLKKTGTNSEIFNIQNAFWRVLLWPVSQLISEGNKSHLTPAGSLPDKLPGYIDLSELKDLAVLAGVSIESAWKAGAVDSSDERRLISAWLMRHTKDQLHKLRAELKEDGHTNMDRRFLVNSILEWHKPGKPLPVPKRLQKLFK